jgi:glycogen synthase
VFDDADVLAEMRQAAMARSFHWSAAAAEYELLYSQLIGRRLPQVAAAPARRTAVAAELQAAA